MVLPETILVFDTETTGLPLFKEPANDPRQPHLVQLAFILYHRQKPVMTWSHLICSEHRSESAAERVHGKTFEARSRFGVAPSEALVALYSCIEEADMVVAHNLAFDFRMIRRTHDHLGLPREAEPAARANLCTMLLTTDLLRLPGSRGFKWPKLHEAYTWCFDEVFSDAHDALSDVKACSSILFFLDNNGYLEHDPDTSRYTARRASMALDGA